MKQSTLLACTAVAALLCADLGLSGCNPSATAQQAPPPAAALPLTTASAPPIVDAPAASQLPPAPPAHVARLSDPNDRYAYLDQASAIQYGLGDAPPDYTFDYDGAQPWVWRSDNDYIQVVEPMADGDRYYYYRPGSDYPFLVRDQDYTYGFDNGALVVVYGSSGQVMPPEFVDRRADFAGRYLERGRALYEASQQGQRESVAAANWSARQSRMASERQEWAQEQAQDPDWRSYHDQYQGQEQAQWDGERYRRQAEAARTAQLFNNAAAAAIYWQAAQQAQTDARSHGQNPGGGGHPGGMIPALFGQHNPPPASPQGQPYGQSPAGAGMGGNQAQYSGAQQHLGGPQQGADQAHYGDRPTPGAAPAASAQYADHQVQDQGRIASAHASEQGAAEAQQRQALANAQEQTQQRAQLAAQRDQLERAQLAHQQQAQIQAQAQAQQHAQIAAQREVVRPSELDQRPAAPRPPEPRPASPAPAAKPPQEHPNATPGAEVRPNRNDQRPGGG